MSQKLGEILIAGRHLSPADLKKALDAQLAFGGRLGTNLIDLGVLDEETLTRVLKEQKRVEVATPRMLELADAKALRLLPAKIADRHKAVPFAIEDKKLKVAMIDPTDLIAIDELAFASGCTIVPFIAPEVRVLAYLERYFEIPRPVRHVRRPERPAGPPTAEQEALAPPLQEYEGGATPIGLAAGGKGEPVAPAAAPASEPMVDLSEILGTAPAPSAPESPREVVGLEEAARMLAEADTREDVGEALVAMARQELPRVFAWLIQRERALGWLAHAPGLSGEAARRWARHAQVPLSEPSVLADVVNNKRYYLGELPGRPVDEALATLFGAPPGRNVVLLPVVLGEQVVIVLHGDNGGEPITRFDLKGLRAACQKASLAMEVLLLRSRIRQIV